MNEQKTKKQNILRNKKNIWEMQQTLTAVCTAV